MEARFESWFPSQSPITVRYLRDALYQVPGVEYRTSLPNTGRIISTIRSPPGIPGMNAGPALKRDRRCGKGDDLAPGIGVDELGLGNVVRRCPVGLAAQYRPERWGISLSDRGCSIAYGPSALGLVTHLSGLYDLPSESLDCCVRNNMKGWTNMLTAQIRTFQGTTIPTTV